MSSVHIVCEGSNVPLYHMSIGRIIRLLGKGADDFDQCRLWVSISCFILRLDMSLCEDAYESPLGVENLNHIDRSILQSKGALNSW